MVFKRFQVLATRIPSRCAVCGSWPSQAVCERCVGQFAQPISRCKTCALPVPVGVAQCGECLLSPPALDACHAAVAYAYPWAGLIVDFKFAQQPGHCTSLSLLMRSAPWMEPAIDNAHFLIPMPLSPQRLRERGYNQAQLLARQLSASKTRENILLRMKDMAHQSQLSRAERLKNVKDAFAVDPLLAPQLKDRRIVLVDDVMTTGASLHSAALALRAAGASHVTALVVARTEPH